MRQPCEGSLQPEGSGLVGGMMEIGNLTWLEVEAYLNCADRAVVPLGNTEQHAYLKKFEKRHR